MGNTQRGYWGGKPSKQSLTTKALQGNLNFTLKANESLKSFGGQLSFMTAGCGGGMNFGVVAGNLIITFEEELQASCCGLFGF